MDPADGRMRAESRWPGVRVNAVMLKPSLLLRLLAEKSYTRLLPAILYASQHSNWCRLFATSKEELMQMCRKDVRTRCLLKL